MDDMDFFSADTITDNHWTLRADTDKITNNRNQHLSVTQVMICGSCLLCVDFVLPLLLCVNWLLTRQV